MPYIPPHYDHHNPVLSLYLGRARAGCAGAAGRGPDFAPVHGTRPRPGHTDLAGSLKYNHTDARNILERSSARETAARVACGGLAKVFLRSFGIDVLSHTTAIGNARVPADFLVSWEQLETIREDDLVRCGANNASDPLPRGRRCPVALSRESVPNPRLHFHSPLLHRGANSLQRR